MFVTIGSMRVFAATAFVSAVIAGAALAATAQPSSSQWTWRSLHRPLHIPRLAAGTPCPVSGPADFDFAKYGVTQGVGPGPAYPVALRQPGTILDFEYPPSAASVIAGSKWGGNKVLWFVAPSYTRPVLVRGRQLDGSHGVRFELLRVPTKELRIAPVPEWLSPRRDRGRASTTRVQAPGCYAYQIDGRSFSRIIVFEARLSNT